MHAVLFCLWGVVSISVPQPPVNDPLPARPLPVELVGLIPDSPVVILSPDQLAELDQWAHAFTEWQKTTDRWLNRRRESFWSYNVERDVKPVPPVWLSDLCAFLGDDPQVSSACSLLVKWRDDPVTARGRQASATVVTQREAPTKTSWWQRVHVDGMWSTTQSNKSVFGLFGAHLTVEVEGRFQIFIVPGILLVSAPGFYGSRELWPATDWGASYRLFNAGRSTVHFNLVHAWLLSSPANLANTNLTLAGFSVTFRPRAR